MGTSSLHNTLVQLRANGDYTDMQIRIENYNSKFTATFSDFSNDLEWIDHISNDDIGNNLDKVSGFNGIYLLHPNYSCYNYNFYLILVPTYM